MKLITLSRLTYLLLFFSFLSFGQHADGTAKRVFGRNVLSENPTTGITKCVSTEYEAYIQETDKNRANTAEFEAWLAPKVEEIKRTLLSGKNTNNVITIPVVVHVIHSGQAVGVGRNISDARVLSQITVLNEDFRRMLNTPGYNTNAVGADIEIEFCLAQRKPDGTSTDGINRVNLGNTSWTESNIENTLKPTTQWDPTQYFNIWVCEFGGSLASQGVLGYAQFPSNSTLGGISINGGLASTDGVIISWKAFGSSDYVTGNYFPSIDKGRTSTHEIGHCFGLRHIWGDSSSCIVNATDSYQDYCPDTPAAAMENFDCFQVYNSCMTSPGNDMTENYMDYTNDACMNVFTLDQKARMLAVLANSPRRSTLANSLGCQAVLSTSDFDAFGSISVFPNPVNDVLTISLGTVNDLPKAYSIYNNLGQLMGRKVISSTADLSIPTAQLSSGMYFITIEKESAAKTLKFLKN